MSNTNQTPSFKVIRKLTYVETNHTEVVIRLALLSGGSKTFTIERSMLAHPPSLHKFFVSKNVRMPIAYKEAGEFLSQVIASEDVEATPVVKEMGWHSNTYVTAHGSYGDNPKIKLHDFAENKAREIVGKHSGNLKAYKKVIRPLLRGSGVFRLMVGIQCASVLSGKVDIGQPTIFHLGGASGRGKTALIRAAMSIVGRAKRKDPPTYATSLPGREDYLSSHRHSAAILDEMGAASGDDVELFKEVKNLAFHFSSGQGRALSAVYKKQTGRSRPLWDQHGVSSGERTLKQLQTSVGKKLVEGVLRRMIDIPAPLYDTIFDIKIGGKIISAAKGRKILADACDKLVANHGVALEPFVNWIVANPKIMSEFAAVRDKFIRAVAADSGWHHAVISSFASCCAGGVMGIRAGIIPCKEKTYISSIKRLCYDSIKYTSLPENHAEELAGELMKAISDPSKVSRKNKAGRYPSFDRKTSLGFVGSYKGKPVTMIMARNLTKLTGSQQGSADVGRHLLAKGRLLPGSKGLTQPVDMPDGGNQMRCYRVLKKVG